MYCPHCREGNPDDAKFCGACGQKLALNEIGRVGTIFKWIGIIVVGFLVLLMLGSM